MFAMKSVMFLCLSLPVWFVNAKLVPYIDPCHYDDSECLLKSSKKAQSYLASGDPKLGIASLDPLVMPREINADNGDLKLKLKNLVIKNLSKCKITKIVRTTPLNIIIEVTCPFIVTGDYEMLGKVWVVDTEGSGPFEIKTNQMKLTLSINMIIEEKNGEEYYKCTGFDYSYDALEKVDMIFHNLFNGDRAKAEPVETLLSESWKELFTVMGKPVMKDVITQIIHIVGKVFTNTPRKEIELL